MPRLFWKFFTIIWLTLAATVGAIFLIVNLFHPVPFAREPEQQQQKLVVNQTAHVLRNDGGDAAARFAHASEEAAPLGLRVSRSPDAGECADMNPANTKSILKDGVCYRISVSERSGFNFYNLPLLMPWLAMLVSSTISAAALARYLIRPVVHLRDGLSALAQGRFDIRIGDKMAGRRDEVTALAHDFDASAARLQELQDAQQRLFHDVSHELRSPLSRLQAVVGVLRQSPAKLAAMLDRMDREVERLDALVGEVLTLARLTTTSNLRLKTQNLDVIDLLNEVLSDAAFEAEGRKIAITPNVDGCFLADVDGELIYRAFENVIRNAVKYTHAQSKITVRCETSLHLLKVCVSDQGPGVKREELERIFQPFARGSDVEPKGGYGLGLAIARQAVERHGGRVYASQPEAGGLAVTLELPGKSSPYGVAV